MADAPKLTPVQPEGVKPPVRPGGEWQDLRGFVQRQAVEMLRLIIILVQDSVLLVVGFLAALVIHWLHSSEPLFQLATGISSALFLFIYSIAVTVHVVNYVRGQLGTKKADALDRYLLWGLTVLAVVVAAVAITLPRLEHESEPEAGVYIIRSTIVLPPDEKLGGQNRPTVALSPDGRLLAYVGKRGSIEQLYLRPLESSESKVLTGTEGAAAPFFSPDGQWIGFFAQGKLKKVSVTGSGTQQLADAGFAVGGSWGTDDTIYFAPTNVSGIWKVHASGGKPEQVTQPDRTKGEFSHRWPQILPGGKALLFTVWTGPGWDESKAEIQVLATGERKIIAEGASTARYVPPGQLVYSHAGNLVSVPFDLASLRMSSEASALQETVSESTEGAHYDFSANGTLAYVSEAALPSNGNARLVWVNRKGIAEQLAVGSRPFDDLALSPDGRRVALSISGSKIGIWIYDLAHETLAPVTTSEVSSQAPVWSPDGRYIVYRGTRSGYRNLYWKSVEDASTLEERLAASDYTQTPGSWTPDGKLLAFYESNPTTSADIWVLPMQGDRKPSRFLETPSNERSPKFSPDGHWIAYASDESGIYQIYVQRFPGPSEKILVSTQGGVEPLWARNGHELYYRNADKMMAVSVTLQPLFRAGTPRMLFEGHYRSSPTGTTGYDISLDGQRFLMLQPTETDQPATQINVVLNWFNELKNRAPQ